ncbi:T5orf172 domain protein [Vibrio splendidus]|nr:T5orf172 domain protein [Vibrio splendidus]
MDCVYIMTNISNHCIIKVGYSNDPERRVKELNKQEYGKDLGCSQWQINTLYRSKSGLSARALETKAHKLLSRYQIKVSAISNSELFACTANTAKAILASAPSSTRQRKPKTKRFMGQVIGQIKCPITGDTYYYANQQRFNFRTKETEDLTEHEWLNAKKLYESIQ